MKKRILSLLLVLVLVAGMMSVTAFADGEAVTVKASTNEEEYYIGSEFTVTVAVNQSGYAGLQINTEYSSSLSLEEVEIVSGLGGYPFQHNGNFIWINCGRDEDGNPDVSEGAVNTDYTGNVAMLTFKIKDKISETEAVAGGDTATVSVTVIGVDAEETAVIDSATASASITVAERPYVLGDVNFDGSIDITDALLIAYFDAGRLVPTATEFLAADVNKDETVDITDALYVAYYDAGKIESFE